MTDLHETAAREAPGTGAARSRRDKADTLGDRLKAFEGKESMRRAMPGLPVVVRVDGRSFSRFTRGMERPFDPNMAALMVDVAGYLLEKSGALVAYTQSDEISLIIDPAGEWVAAESRRRMIRMLDSFEESFALDATTAALRARIVGSAPMGGVPRPGLDRMLFGGRLQKLTSVIAGLATARFLRGAMRLWPERCERLLPIFDCRVFQVPDREEAVDALLWREMDAAKNAVSMAARAHFPHSRLQGKSSREMQEMLSSERGVVFGDYPVRFRRGVYLRRVAETVDLDAAALARIPAGRRPEGPVMRTRTVTLDIPPIAMVRNRVEVLLEGAEALHAKKLRKDSQDNPICVIPAPATLFGRCRPLKPEQSCPLVTNLQNRAFRPPGPLSRLWTPTL